MNYTKESYSSRVKNWMQQSIYFKLASIGFIIILLMIPNAIVMDMIHERSYRQTEVVHEVSSKWGSRQVITGPVLSVPYKHIYENSDGETFESIKYAHFLPEKLEIDGSIKPEYRKRGIYNVVLYQSLINHVGYFDSIDITKLGIDRDLILFDQAFLQVSIPDMTGINDKIDIDINGSSYQMEPGIKQINGFQSGVKIPIDITNHLERLSFAFDLNLNGSESLSFGPVGKETNVKLQSKWPSPSFMGNFLPDQHSVTEDGFTASWRVLDLNRNYPQSWVDSSFDLNQFLFGLVLMEPVNEYARNIRSAKYALLVIVLCFLVFFFFEIVNKQSVHPLHYILIGLAISIFYFLLLSISEHFGFNIAYLISASVTIGLITAYSRSILDTKYLSMILAAILTAVMTFIFVILQLEDFALLVGTIGLFVVLASVMYFSRNIDWNGAKTNVKMSEVI